MNEPVFKLTFYDFAIPAQEKLYREEVFKFAQRYVGEVNFQAEMATVQQRGSNGFYRSTEGDDLAITLLENWPEDFADEDLVSSQLRAQDIQSEECRRALVGVDADWMDETEDDY
jgi:hypothetical protein